MPSRWTRARTSSTILTNLGGRRAPNENGRLHEPGKKKRSLFGLKHAEDTGAFEPINVTMGGGRAVGQEKPEEEYYPDAELEPTPAQPARSAKKHGFFGSLFDREEETEELMIPEERRRGAFPVPSGSCRASAAACADASAASCACCSLSRPWPPCTGGNLHAGGLAQQVHPPGPRAAEESGHTVEIIQGTVAMPKTTRPRRRPPA